MKNLPRILKAFLIAVLTLVAVEQAGRLWLHEPPERLFQDDPGRVWSLRPGNWLDPGTRAMVHVNSLGLRGPEPVEGQTRVLLLGDSRVFGMFLKDRETLDRGLEKALRRACGGNVAVFNGGVPGYSTEQALEVLADVGPILRPQVIVLFNCMGDQRKSLTNDRARLGPRPLRQVRRWLWERSLVYRSLSRWQRGEGQQEQLMDGGQVFRVPPEEIALQMQRFRELAEASGARRLAVVLLPDDSSRPERVGSPKYRPLEHIRALKEEGAALGPVLDLWQRWADEKRPVERLFFETRVHPRPEGVDILVEQLAPELAALVCGEAK